MTLLKLLLPAMTTNLNMKSLINEESREKLPRQAKNAKAIIEIDDDDNQVEPIEALQKPKVV